jgi:hypothetical protein
MSALAAMIDRIETLPRSKLRVRRKGNTVSIELPGPRHQDVELAEAEGVWELTTKVAPPRALSELQPRQIAELVWKRNQNTDFVDFYVDGRRRLMARVRLLGEATEVEELAESLAAIALEADRFEMVVTGEDRF